MDARLILILLACIGLTACDGVFTESAHSTDAFSIEVYKPVETPINYNVSILDLSETVSEPVFTNIGAPVETTVPVQSQQPETMPVVEQASVQVRQYRPVQPVQYNSPNTYQMPEPVDDRQMGIDWAKRMGVIDIYYCRGRSPEYVRGCVDQARENRKEYDEKQY